MVQFEPTKPEFVQPGKYGEDGMRYKVQRIGPLFEVIETDDVCNPKRPVIFVLP